MKKEPSVGMVIINWNGKKDTIELINSLNKINYKNYEIFLVDNNSSVNSIERLKQQIMEYLGEPVIIEMKVVDTIDQQGSKYRYFISLIN